MEEKRAFMSGEEFYLGKSLKTTEWWLSDCHLPLLVWARLRIFNDGTADACWDDGGILYGFETSQYAGFFLAEDEYRSFAHMDEEDERELGLALRDISPPSWNEHPRPEFEYVGKY